MRRRTSLRGTNNYEHSGDDLEMPESRLQVKMETDTRKTQSRSSSSGEVKYHFLKRFSVAILLFVLVASFFLYTFSRAMFTDFDWLNTQWATSPSHSSSPLSLSLDKPLSHLQHSSRPATTITLQWVVSSGFRAPDGVQKWVYLINGDFPGPVVEARSGDTLDILVINTLKNEGLSIHFHGLHMRGFNSMDGAVGYTQEPIKPGDSFRYRFQISEDQAGTFWYHSHEELQRADGLYGALIVHQPKPDDSSQLEPKYDEERVLVVNDWYHRPAKELLAWYMSAGSYGMEPAADSILVNGIGAYNCSNAVPALPVSCHQLRGNKIPKMTFDGSRVYRLRVINAGMLAGISISFTGHAMTVIEVDGGQTVIPQTAHSIGVLYPGQRMDVVLEWGSSVSSSSMQIELDPEAFKYVNLALTARQHFPIIFNSPAELTKRHTNQHFDLMKLLSSKSVPPDFPTKVQHRLVLYTKTLKLAHLSNAPHGFINQTTWKPQSPPLITLNRSDYNKYQLVPFVPLTEPAQWVDIFLNNQDDDHHPFHLHGYDAYVLQTYASTYNVGSWNPFETNVPPGGILNLQNPIPRDTFIVPRRGYVVLRLKVDNTGVWMFHCHVLWHQASGMAMGIEAA
jgi:FtsP/CotA-like multicopper oxidase with cupredoxin domain